MDPSESRRPSVLIVGYALIAGGGETFPIFLANELRRRGWPVAFLDCALEDPEADIRALLAHSVPLYRLLKQEDLGQLCRRLGIDVVHSCHTSTDLLVSRCVSQLPTDRRPKHVVTLHGGYETLSLDPLLIHLSQVQAVDQFVYTAVKNLTSFPKQFLARCPFVRIANALPTATTVSRDRAELGIRDEQTILTMLISRAVPGKGWKLAVEAVEDARVESGRDIHLALIGNGPVYDDMRGVPAPAWLHLLGVQRHIRSWIAIADIGLLPSTFSGESYPLVLIDFLTMGLPVITSAAGEIPQMMASTLGTPGYVVDEVDELRLEERIAGHLVDFAALGPHDRADLRARALDAAAKFDFAAMVDAYEDVYERVSS